MAQSTTDDERWERLIDVAAEFGLRHPDAVLDSGTVPTLYAGHRISVDADFIFVLMEAWSLRKDKRNRPVSTVLTRAG